MKDINKLADIIFNLPKKNQIFESYSKDFVDGLNINSFKIYFTKDYMNMTIILNNDETIDINLSLTKACTKYDIVHELTHLYQFTRNTTKTEINIDRYNNLYYSLKDIPYLYKYRFFFQLVYFSLDDEICARVSALKQEIIDKKIKKENFFKFLSTHEEYENYKILSKKYNYANVGFDEMVNEIHFAWKNRNNVQTTISGSIVRSIINIVGPIKTKWLNSIVNKVYHHHEIFNVKTKKETWEKYFDKQSKKFHKKIMNLYKETI